MRIGQTYTAKNGDKITIKAFSIKIINGVKITRITCEINNKLYAATESELDALLK